MVVIKRRKLDINKEIKEGDIIETENGLRLIVRDFGTNDFSCVILEDENENNIGRYTTTKTIEELLSRFQKVKKLKFHIVVEE